jgi:hypothetical protein
MGGTMDAVTGSEVRVGRRLRDGRGNEWVVVRLYLDKGEAMVCDESRRITRFFHPVHDRGEMVLA